MAKKSFLGRWLKRLFYLLLLLFITSNFIIYNQAYHFTHFVDKDLPKVTSETVSNSSWSEKIKLGIYGVEVPKSRNTTQPTAPYKTITMGSHPQLHAWWIPTEQAPQGIAIFFHGYSSSKSSQIERARVLRSLGYHTFLVDFRGHGDSEGLQTSIGYHEAYDVQTAYEYIKTYYDLPITMFGTSMGAVSITKAIKQYHLDVKNIVLECPYGSLSDAVYSRFENMKLPTVLLPELLLFWGGVQANMNSWNLNTVDYAKSITVPALILYGAQDPKVRRHEIDAVFQALKGPKKLEILEKAAHDNIMQDDPKTWTKVVWDFLESY